MILGIRKPNNLEQLQLAGEMSPLLPRDVAQIVYGYGEQMICEKLWNYYNVNDMLFAHNNVPTNIVLVLNNNKNCCIGVLKKIKNTKLTSKARLKSPQCHLNSQGF